jgi:hypothetical protein
MLVGAEWLGLKGGHIPHQIQLRADHIAQTRLPRRHMAAHHAGQAVAVTNRQRRNAQRRRSNR